MRKLALTLLLLQSNASLAQTLWGVITSSEGRPGVALIEIAPENVQAYHEGDVVGLWRLVKIEDKAVLLANKQKEWRLQIGPWFSVSPKDKDQPASLTELRGIEKHEDKVYIAEDLKRHLTSDGLHTVLMQAAVRPVYDWLTGALYGFKIWDIEPGSIFDRVGLLEGDLITEIDGTTLTDVFQTIRLLQSLKEQKEIAVTFLRDSKEMTIRLVTQ